MDKRQRDMFNQEIRGNLARLLATENLVVEHRKVTTASFDVIRRVLTLPLWDKASKVVYDLLVGHEVGHALYTPADKWDFSVPKDFVNVVEDARIEKLMKRKYAGLNKDFYHGYQELNEQDFFDIEGQDLNEFNLIDRINLHFKIGAYARIPFSTEENVYVDKVADCETFEDVLSVCRELKEYLKQQQEQKTPDNLPKSSQEGQQSPTVEPTAETDTEEDQEETDDSNDSNSDGDRNEADIENATFGKQGGETFESQTQKAFDEAAEELTNDRPYAQEPVYVEVPSVDLKKVIVDYDKLQNYIGKYWKELAEQRAEQWGNIFESVDADFNDFKKSSQKEVNYLVKEFECRKSADAYARAGQSKTGVLDTSKLHTYRYNEDIFKKVTVLPDGKNHGMIFILDWSGSMANELLATVKQLLNLTAFCKKVQIPFEVYAFTNDWYPAQRALDVAAGKDVEDNYYHYYPGIEKDKFYIDPRNFHLLNFVSSRSNAKEYERQCKNLWREASVYRNYTGYQATIGCGLSGTPLNEAVIMLNYIIPQFKKQNDLQKVNVCILTDGEGCQSGYGHEIYLDHKDEYTVRPRRIDYGIRLRDRQTGRVYPEFEYDTITNIFIQQVRDRNPDVNVIGFRILSGSQLQGFVGRYATYEGYSQVQKQWKKEKSAIIPNPQAFSALYAISNNGLDDTAEFNVESGAKKGEISRAFKKMLGSKSTNKKLLNSFIEYVS